MQNSDVNNNADGRMDIMRQNSSPKTASEAPGNLPKEKPMGKNSDGYDILPKK